MSEQFTGTVRVKDGNKGPVDFSPNREVEVTISFAVDEGGNLKATAEQAASLADDIVNEKLGRAEGAKPARVTKTKADKPPAVEKASPAAVVEQKAAASPAIVEQKVAASPSDLSTVAEVKQAIQTGGERVDPAAIGDDPLFSSAVEARVINDNELMSAITRKNAETNKNSSAIRALIGQYVPQDGKPHQAAEITADKRQAFLTELEKVPKLGA